MKGLARKPFWQNLALAVTLLLGTLLTAEALPYADGAWWITTVLAFVCVALRDRWPLPMMALCSLTAIVHLSRPTPITLIDLATPILLYTIASRYSRWLSGTVLVGLILTTGLWSVTVAEPQDMSKMGMDGPLRPPPPPAGVIFVDRILVVDNGALILLGSMLVASWALGVSAARKRVHMQDLERQRDQQAAFAAAAERSRISRELHDVVAHGLSVMVVQAQGGQAALARRPADTEAALAAIVQVGRDSLAEMRRVINDVEWRPQSGMSQLPRLLDQVRQAGFDVQLRIEGEPVALASTVDLAGYRIVQEALTNTMKHAGSGATALVEVSYQDDNLLLAVSDNGRGPRGDDNRGTGLRGMRERAQLLRGELTAGPGPQGGFVVRARLPIA